MPELPDVAVYIEALDARIRGARLERVHQDWPRTLDEMEDRRRSLSTRA
jgi:formamidopyrimidine-DNA glycosylase